MLVLSEILLEQGDEISSFSILKLTVQNLALARNELLFNIDIEPPAFPDRPTDWHEQLNLAFESAR